MPTSSRFYLVTYDLSYLAFLLTGLCVGALAWKRIASPPFRRFPDAMENTPLREHISATFAAWALLAIVPLFGFYLRVPVIASRYLLDFMPAFGALLVVAWLGLCRFLKGIKSVKGLVPSSF